MQVPCIYPRMGYGIRDNSCVDGEQLKAILAKNVRERMALLGLKQDYVPGVSQSTISRILLRGPGYPTLETLANVAKGLSCQPWQLLVDDDQIREDAIRKALSKG